MVSLAFLAIASALLALLFTPLCRALMLRWGVVDAPDEVRKFHGRPIARAGGVAVAAAYVCALGLWFAMPLEVSRIMGRNLEFILKILPAAGIVLAVGLTDDVFGLRPVHKLAGQAVAAVVAFHAGIRIDTLMGHEIGFWWSVPLTVVWLVGCSNAFNIIDGMDGLAAGLGFCAAVTMVIASYFQSNLALAAATVPLAGALLGFLRYNFNPASIFLGDSGSLLIGFQLGCFAVAWSQKSATLAAITAPALALAIPLADAALAIFRRFVSGKPIFSADRSHIHHRLLDRGLSTRHAVLVLYGVAGTAATFSLLLGLAGANWTGLVICLFFAASWAGLRRLHYGEFTAVHRVVCNAGLQQRLQREVSLEALERGLEGASTPTECWEVIRAAARNAGFVAAELRLADASFAMGQPDRTTMIAVEVPLAADGWLHLFRNAGDEGDLKMMGPLASWSKRSLDAKRFGTDRATEPTSIAALDHALRAGFEARVEAPER